MIIYLIFFTMLSTMVLAREDIDANLIPDMIYIPLVFIILVIAINKIMGLKTIPLNAKINVRIAFRPFRFCGLF